MPRRPTAGAQRQQAHARLEEHPMALKVAFCGKGGVGKTTVAALYIRKLAASGIRVVAVDADPVPNLAAALGFPRDLRLEPLSALRDLVEERTGAQPGWGTLFRLNPRVDDLPERLGATAGNVRLLVMGTVDKGGSGCVCPESVMLKALVSHLLLQPDQAVVLDMEAGVEHLGRGTAAAVDRMIAVVDGGQRSHEAARKIRALAADLGVTSLSVIVNRVRSAAEAAQVREALPEMEFLGALPWDPAILDADRSGTQPYPDLSCAPAELTSLVEAIGPVNGR
jgi:CO dehydrogenase maturation factor